MIPSEAYDEAHNQIANKIEKAAVKAAAIRGGHPDPDAFYQKYQDYWKQGAAEAKQRAEDPTIETKRHPDAHTTRYGLDESSGVKLA